MRAVRTTIATIYAAITLISGCWIQAKPALSNSPLSKDQLSVYQGFLNRFSSLNIRNLSSVTISFDFKGFPDGRPCLGGLELESVSEPLQTTHSLDQEITKRTDIRLVDPLEQGKLRQEGDASRQNQKEKATGGVQKAKFD
jgi:hypothetical protein